MTKRILIALLAMLVALAAAPVFAQDNTATVKGKAIDEKGKPIAGAVVRFTSADGKKLEVKTDKQGEFQKAGIPTGKYKVQLLIDSTLRWAAETVVNPGQEAHLTIDLAAEAAAAAMTTEQKKQAEAQREKAEAEHAKIKNLNALLAQAKQLENGGDLDGAIGIYQKAVQVDASKDLLWANLGGAYITKAKKTTDRTQQKEIAQQAADALKKAVEIKATDAAYHNNLAQAYNLAGDSEAAIKEYQQAVQSDPTNAGQYYFNMGAVYTNTGKVDDAVAAFDKAIASDPNKADAYYWKGINLLAKATIDPKTNKMVAPPGTAEAFNKYLELDPNGKLAQPAKEMLTQMGASVETTYKKGGTKKK